jgi:hypothetical protein
MRLDPQDAAGLLEARLPLGVKGMAHGKDQIVVCHHGFDPIRQGRDHFFQEGDGVAAGAVWADTRLKSSMTA